MTAKKPTSRKKSSKPNKKSNSTNNKHIPRWAIVMVSLVVAVAGMFLIYDSLAVQRGRVPVESTGNNTSNYPPCNPNSGVDEVCRVEYRGRIMFKKRTPLCAGRGGFKFRYENASNNSWKCADGSNILAASRAPAGDLVWHWQLVADCESTDNINAYNPAGPYYGWLQFLQSTWTANGGTGSPQGQSREAQATVAEGMRLAGGIGAWPVCGGLYR